MHILLHFFEAMMEARAMSWGVLALTAGTLGKRLLAWNIKASGSCFCGFVWKTPSFCGHLLALPTLYALQVFTWLGHADWSGTYALCPVSISALRNDGIWKETLHLLYRLKHLGVWKVRYKWLSCINPLCFDENILFLIPLSKQVCIYVCVCVCVLNAKALVKPACFRMWIISQAALCVSLQCGFPLGEALKPWIFSLACTCCQKLVGDSFLFNAEKRTSFYCKYF